MFHTFRSTKKSDTIVWQLYADILLFIMNEKKIMNFTKWNVVELKVNIEQQCIQTNNVIYINIYEPK